MKNVRITSKFILAITFMFVVSFWAGEPVFAGRIAAWGWNYYGQCDVPSGNDFIAIAARWKHSLALKSDGSIVGWGQNNHRQSDSPTGNDFIAISAGCVHSLALKADGSLLAWGYNGNG
jgi:alpha-tubulin suppressor-like RCC1 family protein